MPELIQQQRTMQRPGEGIVPPSQPTKEHERYPMRMTHQGFAPAVTGERIAVGDPDRPAFVYNKPGTPMRYPHVLVHSEQDEEHHLALGYKSAGKCSPQEFTRLAQSNAPPIEFHVSVEYPKWVLGKLVKTAEEEAALTGKSKSSEVPGDTPQVDAEVNTLQVWPVAPEINVDAHTPHETDAVAEVTPLTEEDFEIATLEAKIAERREKTERIARLKLELAELEGEAAPVVTLNAAAVSEPLVMKDLVAVVEVSRDIAAAITQAVAAEAAQAGLEGGQVDDEPKARLVVIPATETHIAHLEFVPVAEENVTLPSGLTVRQSSADQPSDDAVISAAVGRQTKEAAKAARAANIKAGIARSKAAKAAAKSEQTLTESVAATTEAEQQHG